jgi:polysaccharide biosynthesis transport protein
VVRPVTMMRERTPTFAAGDDGIDFRTVLSALRRRKGIILTTMILVTASAVGSALLITPRYTATAVLLVKPHELRVVEMQAVAEGLPQEIPGADTVLPTQRELLAASSRARRIITKLDLVSDPEFNPALPAPNRITMLAEKWLPERWLVATGLAGQGAELDRQLPEATHANSGVGAEPTQRIVDNFLDRLEVDRDGTSNVLSVSFSSADPAKAAQIANAIAESYVADQLEGKVEVTTRASDWVAARIEELREEVLRAERAAEEYRAANDLMAHRDDGLDVEQLASLRGQLITARAERGVAEARLRQVRELWAQSADIKSIGEVVSSPIIMDLRQREARLRSEQAQLTQEYGPRHPRVLQNQAEIDELASRLEQEIGSIIRNLEDEVAIAQGRERALTETLDETKQDSALSNQTAIQLRELEREAEAKRALYETLLRRQKEIQEQRDLLQPDAEVVSLASVPDRPSFPNLKLIAIIGFATSAIIGPLMAALAEHLDRGLRTGRQLEEVLHLPSLGLVPSVSRSRHAQTPYHYFLKKPLSAYAEAIREVQLALERLDDAAPPQVILLTSSLPGEGKTTLAMSLAASFARSGCKTLIMDLDLRHPSIGREIAEPVGLGLIDLLTGGRRFDEVVRTDPYLATLDVLPVASHTPGQRAPRQAVESLGPSDLIGSRKMGRLFEELRKRYDAIVVDAPPALGTTDAKIAALWADAVVFVVRWHETPASVALSGLHALRKNQIPVTGAVLTQVDLRHHVKYGYDDVGQYYGEHKNYYIE